MQHTEQEKEYIRNKTIKFYGSAGTGKTSTLKNKIEEEIKGNKIFPDQIAYLTFTRKEARHGLSVVSELGYEVKDLKWFRTIHSCCFRLLGLERTDIVTEQKKKEFFKEINIDYNPEKEKGNPENALADLANLLSNPDDYVDSNIKEGNIYLSIIDWCRQSFPYEEDPLSKFAECPINNPELLEKLFNKKIIKFRYLDYRYIQQVNDQYLKFKTKEGLYDFTDLLDYVFIQKLYPPVKILIVDEAQDLSPLQWAIVDLWIKDEDIYRAYLAGDYNQAIYGFAGAVPELLKNYPARMHFIPVTHRFGEEILNFSKRVIRDPMLEKLHPCSDENCSCNNSEKKSILVELGDKEVLTTLQKNNDEGRETFCLFRTNRLMNQFIQSLIIEGIPFRRFAGGNVWTNRTTKTGHNLILLNNIIQKMKQPKELWVFTYLEFLELIKSLKANVAGLLRGLKTDVMRIVSEKKPKRYNSFKVAINLNSLMMKNKITYHTLYNCFVDSDKAKQCLNSNHITNYMDISELQIQCLKYSKSLVYKDKIVIELSTIHKAKGQERRDVFLFTDINKIIEDNMKGNNKIQGEEQRVFYVGVTRSKERLFIVNNYFGGRYKYYLPTIRADKENVQFKQRIQRIRTELPTTQIITNIHDLSQEEIKLLIQNTFKQFSGEENVLTKKELFNNINLSDKQIDPVFTAMMDAGDIYEPRPEKYRLFV